jgi:hypothetical protein
VSSHGLALLAVLGRVRRRLRALAALEGAVVAGALALLGFAAWLAAARWRGGPMSPIALRAGGMVALASSGLGAALAALRPIALERCARILDRRLGGHDRMLSALAFAEARDAATPFSAAAIEDAVRRGAPLRPASVAPLRRPRGLIGLASGALLAIGAALLPLPARGSRAPIDRAARTTPQTAVLPRVRMDRAALDPERDEAARALRAAATLQDEALARLARELAATAEELSRGGVARGDALDQLADLQRRSEDAAAETERIQQALDRAGKALQGGAATREAGQALRSSAPDATEAALTKLAARAAQASAGERNQIADALAHAGERAGDQTGERTGDQAHAGDASAPPNSPLAPLATQDTPADDQPPQRRLARDDPRPTGSRPPTEMRAPTAPRDRRLQRLERDLKDAAAACRGNPEGCRNKLQQQAHDLPRMEQEARSAAPRQRLAQAVRQLRERLRREGQEDAARQRAERRFLRAARGQSGQETEEAIEADRSGRPDRQVERDDGNNDGEIDDDGDPVSPAAELTAGTARAVEAGEGAARTDRSRDSAGSSSAAPDPGQRGADLDGPGGGPGDGVGNQAGGDPLGAAGDRVTARGRAREAQVRNAAGPNRSQVIQSAAQRGFAHSTYQGVFNDYQAAVEESLDASAVPPGRRYIVRRYFQLIRPQAGAPRARGDR